MFGNLMKYEMKSMTRFFVLVWIAILAVSAIDGVMLRLGFMESEGFVELISTLGVVLYGILVAGAGIMALVFTIMRFHRNLLGSEGYLMFTLPVSVRKLIVSKSLTAVIAIAVTVVVAAVSVLLLGVVSTEMTPQLSEILKAAGTWIKANPGFIPIAIEFLVLMLICCLETVYKIYAAIAIGHMAQKHKLVASFAAYIGLGIAESVILYILDRLVVPHIPTFDWYINMGNNGLDVMFQNGVYTAQGAAYIGLCMAGVLVLTVIYHTVTEFFLKRKLNLE